MSRGGAKLDDVVGSSRREKPKRAPAQNNGAAPQDEPDADPADETKPMAFAGLGFGITVRQKKLADGWLEHGNGTRAARDAGYAGNNATLCQQASAVLRYANVRAYIASRLGETEIDERAIKGMLAQEAMTAPSDGARVRAQELLGKTRGMFLDQIGIGRMDALDDVSLARKIAGGNPALEAVILARLRGEDSPAIEGPKGEGDQ